MLRKLLLVGIFAGSSASVPILYQANPEAFHDIIRSAVSEQEEPQQTVASVNLARPAQPVPASTLGRKVRLEADSRGHFTADFKFNGRRVQAVIDTGATLVAMNASTARRVGISITPADFKYTVETANGKAKAAAARIDSLQIGKIAIDDVDAIVLQDDALKDTLIGVSFLNRLNKYQVENGVLLMAQ